MAEYLEEEFRAGFAERHIAEFIDGQQLVFDQLLQRWCHADEDGFTDATLAASIARKTETDAARLKRNMEAV